MLSVKLRIVESHSASESAEHLNIRAALSQRRNRLVRHLKEVVSIRRLQIFMFEEGRRRQDDVGIVGGVGEELIVDHRNQIRALETANHVVVIWTDRCGT